MSGPRMEILISVLKKIKQGDVTVNRWSRKASEKVTFELDLK